MKVPQTFRNTQAGPKDGTHQFSFHSEFIYLRKIIFKVLVFLNTDFGVGQQVCFVEQELNVKLGTGLLISNTKSTVKNQLFLTQNKALTLFGNNQFLQLPYKFYNGLVDCETTTEGTMSSLTTVSTGESLDAFGDQNVTCVESQKRKLFHPPQSPSKGHTRRTQ